MTFENFSIKVPDPDMYETLNSIDYETPPFQHGIPVVDNQTVTFASKANAKEGWVDLYVVLGIDDWGMMIPAKVRQPDGSSRALTHRIYTPVKILKVDPVTGDFIRRS